MHISKLQFYGIIFLLLLLPLSSEWKQMVFGKKTTGKVVGYYTAAGFRSLSPANAKQSIFEYLTNNGTITTTGPDYVFYPMNREITIFYNTERPDDCLLFTFSGIFLQPAAIVPGVLIILWIALYTTINRPKPKPIARRSSRMEKYWQNISNL
jgi:hypothetical protein